MAGLVKFEVDVSGFSRRVTDFAAVAGGSIQEAFVTQGRLLCGELIKRTPPFSGKSLQRSLEARGLNPGLLDPEIESATAKAVGERRVEKDIRKVIYGVKGAAMPRRSPQVYLGQDAHRVHSPEVLDWGVAQKCEGKDAVRIFATKGGTVYGVDRERFFPNATTAQMKATHEEHRTKRGRVTTAGSRDKVVGRWRWLNILVTKAEAVDAYVKQAKHGVGQAKGGWAEGFIKLGGKLSRKGWIGRHAAAGTCSVSLAKNSTAISITNNSQWASGGDQDRIIAKSFEGREKAIEKDIERRLSLIWGNKVEKKEA